MQTVSWSSKLHKIVSAVKGGDILNSFSLSSNELTAVSNVFSQKNINKVDSLELWR